MTAEIAIMNKSAVALAADSTVTVQINGASKVFPTVNKLFSLSKYQPVGCMVYGSAEFMGMDWETVIKLYRSQLRTKSFPTLNGYANDMLQFIAKDQSVADPKGQETFVLSSFRAVFTSILQTIIKRIDKTVATSAVSDQDIEATTSAVIHEFWEGFREAPNLKLVGGSEITTIQIDCVKDVYPDKKVELVITEIFEDLPVSPSAMSELCEIAIWSLVKDIDRSFGSSGVVFAGYGTKQVFPVVNVFRIDGVFCDHLKFRQSNGAEVSKTEPVVVMPFAQTEMVESFMEGVDPNYQRDVDSNVGAVLDTYGKSLLDLLCTTEADKQKHLPAMKQLHDEVTKKFRDDLNQYRRQQFISPVVDVVADLPKSDLAEMAHSLVNLTSFKRHVTPDQETVGGPIDVAVISRADGFVWINRKHYFRPELNPHYFRNYYREEESE